MLHSGFKSTILGWFGDAQRAIAWVILVGGVLTFIAVLFDVVATGDAKLATILGAILIINDGFQAVQEVENELEEGGEVTE